MPHYNVMGPAKAALEASVRQLAYELVGIAFVTEDPLVFVTFHPIREDIRFGSTASALDPSRLSRLGGFQDCRSVLFIVNHPLLNSIH